jgi:hypothetical protein
MPPTDAMVISIPLLIASIGIIFSSGKFYGQAKKNEENLEQLNEKLDKLTNIVHRLQLDFAIFSNDQPRRIDYKSITENLERRHRSESS